MKTKKKKVVPCDYCGNKLTTEELESPYRNQDGDCVCDECYRDHFQFRCCACEEYEEDEYQHRYLVVFEKVGAPGSQPDVPPGIYAILGGPYYGGPIIGQQYLYPEHLLLVRNLPVDLRNFFYLCGHLCRECSGELIPDPPVFAHVYTEPGATSQDRYTFRGAVMRGADYVELCTHRNHSYAEALECGEILLTEWLNRAEIK